MKTRSASLFRSIVFSLVSSELIVVHNSRQNSRLSRKGTRSGGIVSGLCWYSFSLARDTAYGSLAVFSGSGEGLVNDLMADGTTVQLWHDTTRLGLMRGAPPTSSYASAPSSQATASS
jgi:hypothetical protein